MNESEYLNGVWKRIRKAGPSGQAVIDTGLFDSLWGGEEARKNLMLKQMGDRRKFRDDSLKLSKTRLQMDAANYDRWADFREDDMKEGAVITGAQIPFALSEGMLDAQAMGKEEEEYNKRTKAIRGLMGG